MSASVQPSFAPNEFVYRWLSRTNSPPLDHERDKHHDDLHVISPAPHKNATRSKREAERRNIPRSPNEKGDRAHKSAHHHKHHQKPTQKTPVPYTSILPHADRSEYEEKDFKSHHRRKRPRSRKGASETGEKCPQPRSLQRRLSVVRSKGSSRSEISNGSRGSALPTARVPAVGRDPEKRYERRPRHKTRPDKYEPRVDKKVADKSVHELAHKRSKRKRRKKSGLSLNHDFQAPNVLQERLTLKPNTGPGIFHRGKASAPVERRGLPDLTFSEMNFLTKRRDIDDARHQKSKDVQISTKKTNKGSAQEISGFFSKPEEHNRFLQDPTVKVPGQRERPMKQSISPNKSSPRRPGVRKPLSMLSGNQAHTRAFSTTGPSPAPLSQCWMRKHHVPTVQHYYPAEKGSSERRKRSNSTTSYYSWSATPTAKSILRADLQGLPEAPQSVARQPTYMPLLPSPRKRDVPEVATRPPDQSSISDRSLEQYTKHVLLQKYIQGKCVPAPRAAGSGGHYTLQDLQRLSRVSELDDANGFSTTQFGQPCDSEGQGRINIPLTDLDEHEYAFLAHVSSREGHEASAVRSMASISRNPIHQQRRDEFVSESIADSAAPRAQVTQSGRQGARPADHLPLRDPLQLGDLRFNPDRPVWLPSTNSPRAEFRRRKPVSRNAELARNSPHARLWQTHDSAHLLSRYQDPAKPTIGVGYPQPSLTTQVHSREPTGLGAPVTRPEPFQAHENAFWDGQDDFDRALLQEPCSGSTLDPSLYVLDQFELARTSYSLADPGTGLPHIEGNLEFEDGELEAITLGNNTTHFNTRVALSEEDVAAGSVSGDGLVRNRTSGLDLVLGNGYKEDEEQFLGFTRPHVLY